MRLASVVVVPLLLAASIPSRAQAPRTIPIDTAKRYFHEARALCEADGGRLWGVSLCGPMMFADPQTRSIVASESDAKGALTASEGAFVGTLPKSQNIANTSVDWSGVRWTQVVWPLPNDERTRGTIMLHELFHRIQPQLGLPTLEAGSNAHLDELNGRYYLELEWRALARALEARTNGDRRQASRDALLFRAERYRIYPNAAAQEHELEQHEGLAEYTGVRVGNPTEESQTAMALNDLTWHAKDPSFVRSFAYATGPAYGLLLDRYAPAWREQLKSGESFDEMLRSALHAEVPPNVEQMAKGRAAAYDGVALRTAEVERERKRQAMLALYRGKFVNGPVLTLTFRNMNVQFDPNNVQPLGDAGTVYPTIRISDEWGVVEGKNGALMKPDWSALVLAAPTNTSGSSISGDGWTLELKPGWTIVPGAREGDLVLSPPK